MEIITVYRVVYDNGIEGFTEFLSLTEAEALKAEHTNASIQTIYRVIKPGEDGTEQFDFNSFGEAQAFVATVSP